MEGKIFYTDNGYNMLMTHAKSIYGERGNLEYNLNRYFLSDEYKRGCTKASNLDDIPEINLDVLKAQIEREEYFKNYANALTQKYDELKREKQSNFDASLELAGIMGICPGDRDREQTLFPHLVDLYVSSEEEGNKIWSNVEKNKNIMDIIVNSMTDGLRPGQVILYNDKYVWSQGYARNYFRGENAYYKTSRPSLYRGLSDDITSKLNLFTSYLRQIEFYNALFRLKIIKSWDKQHYLELDPTAIAQHYGIRTGYLDITSDFKVALFFACCKWDSVFNKWLPLSNKDFEKRDSRENIADLGGDSRYGVIFTAPVDVCNMSNTLQIEIKDKKKLEKMPRMVFVKPIGYQPFMRCSFQSGYTIPVRNIHFDLFQDIGFHKFKFRLTEEICNWIYNEMEQGKKIYPNEVNGITEMVNRINLTKVFSKEAFDKVFDAYKPQKSKEEIIELLKNENVIIKDDFVLITDDEIAKIDKEWDENNAQYFNSLPRGGRFWFAI